MNSKETSKTTTICCACELCRSGDPCIHMIGIFVCVICKLDMCGYQCSDGKSSDFANLTCLKCAGTAVDIATANQDVYVVAGPQQ